MTAQIISGTEIAKQIREELKQEIAELKEKHNLIPGLVTILVGEDPASQVYVKSKVRTCDALGVYSERYDLPAETSEEELLTLIDKLNKDPKIHGILPTITTSAPSSLTPDLIRSCWIPWGVQGK